MALRLQNEVIRLVRTVHGGKILATPEWLVRPGKAEIGRRWRLMQRIYRELTGLELPEVMRSVERREVDAVLQKKGSAPRIVEVDEKQHFNEYRASSSPSPRHRHRPLRRRHVVKVRA